MAIHEIKISKHKDSFVTMYVDFGKRLGDGRHSIIFAASDRKDDHSAQTHAVKFLRKFDGDQLRREVRKRFIDEISTLGELSRGQGQTAFVRYEGHGASVSSDPDTIERLKKGCHPDSLRNSLPLEVLESVEGAFYIMEQAACSLDDFLYRGKKHNKNSTSWADAVHTRTSDSKWLVDLRFCLSVIEKVANSVYAFHEKDHRSHRDIKPGNFLVYFKTTDFDVKISDFGGVSQHAVRDDGGAGGPLTGSPDRKASEMNLPGSRGYRAPEQIDHGIPIYLNLTKEGPVGLEETQHSDSSGKKPSNGGAEKRKQHYFVNIQKTDIEVKLKIGDEISLYEPIRGGDSQKISVEQVTPCGLWGKAEGALASNMLIRGDLYRAQGQAADTFAVGCLAYNLGSGGKEAERFVYRILPLALDSASKKIGIGDIATMLYCGSATALAEELGHEFGKDDDLGKELFPDFCGSLGEFVSKRKKDFSQTVVVAEGSGRLRKLLFTEISQLGSKPPIGDLMKMLKFVAADQYVQDEYLRDTAKRPIAWSLLVLSLACILRGFHGSICEDSRSEGKMQKVASLAARLGVAFRTTAAANELYVRAWQSPP